MEATSARNLSTIDFELVPATAQSLKGNELFIYLLTSYFPWEASILAVSAYGYDGVQQASVSLPAYNAS